MDGPWAGYQRATVATCEPDVAGWFVHPVETLSAVAYLIAALWLWRQYGRTDRDLRVRHLPALVAIAGLGSVVFHASYAAAFQTLDLAAIAPLAGFLLGSTLVARYPALQPRFGPLVTVLAIGGTLAPFVSLGLGFAGLGVVTALVIVVAVGRDVPTGARVPRRRAVTFVLAGGVLLALDHAGFGCVEGSLAHVVQPHALWHVLSAVACVHFYRYERVIGR